MQNRKVPGGRIHLQPLGKIAVIDLETRRDPLLAGLITTSKSAGNFIQRIASYSVLQIEELASGDWVVGGFYSVEDDEIAILRAIDHDAETRPTFLTYNGLRHDLPTIRRRLMRHRLFELEHAARMNTLPHVDLYDFPAVPSGSAHGSLQDRCAGLGMDARNRTYQPRDARPSQKGERDVIATLPLVAQTTLASPR